MASAPLLGKTQPALDLINRIIADLQRLQGLLQPDQLDLNPKDPRNKTPDGKLTPRGIEVCYRMFDAGKTRYAVCQALEISFNAATHRLDAWNKAGGSNRVKAPLN